VHAQVEASADDVDQQTPEKVTITQLRVAPDVFAGGFYATFLSHLPHG
jgi:hypothetical protein